MRFSSIEIGNSQRWHWYVNLCVFLLLFCVVRKRHSEKIEHWDDDGWVKRTARTSIILRTTTPAFSATTAEFAVHECDNESRVVSCHSRTHNDFYIVIGIFGRGFILCVFSLLLFWCAVGKCWMLICWIAFTQKYFIFFPMTCRWRRNQTGCTHGTMEKNDEKSKYRARLSECVWVCWLCRACRLIRCLHS